MLLGYFKEKLEYRRKKRIADLVRSGVVPKDKNGNSLPREEIYEALRITRPKGAVEMFGFLGAKHFKADGTLIKDYGLVGCKKVTKAFVNHIVDAMCSEGECTKIDNYVYHVPGAGSAAEASGDTGINEKMTRWAGTNTHGATSNVFSSVVTEMAADSAWTCIEHGIFNAATTSSGVLLDRTVLASSIPMATGDKITFNYSLTFNSET
jgi:hypothetical protein